MLDASAQRASRPELLRVLGLRDLVFLNVVAIVSLRWIARGARADAPSITLWLAACVCFCLPLALAVAVLARRYPEQGGIYAWVQRAFGPFHAALCGWCLWVNNQFYFPSMLLFVAANVAVLFSAVAPGLADHRLFSTVFVLAGIWILVALNVRGFEAGRSLQALGLVSTWIPIVLVVAASGIALALYGSATSFAPAALVPDRRVLPAVALWSAFCFAFSGFEIGACASQEVKNPERTIPRSIALSAAMITGIYIVGTASILVVVPADALAERSGFADAITTVAARVGLPALGALTALLLAVSALATTSAWMAGSARIAYAAALDGRWPPALGRLHARCRTPHVALIVQGVVSSLVFLSSLFLGALLGEAGTTVQDAYDVLVNITIVIYFVPYLYLFVTLIRLGADLNERVDGSRVPAWRGPIARWCAALAGFTATLVSVVLAFVPPEGTANVFSYELNLVLQTAAVMAAGVGIYWWSGTRTGGFGRQG
jgi:amino acid transporter